MSLEIPVSAIADALIATVAATTVPTVVADASRIIYYAGMRNPDSVYPANPRVDCPRIILQLDQDSAVPVALRGGTVTDAEFVAKFFLQIRQTKGTNNQRVLVDAMQKVKLAFLGNFTPARLQTVPGFGGYGKDSAGVGPLITKIGRELNHDLSHPNMRISVASLQFKFTIRIQNH